MTTTLLILSHLACVGIGAALMRWLTPRIAETWPRPPHVIEALEDRMHHRHADESKQDRSDRKTREGVRVSLVVIVCSTLLLIVGAQAWVAQRDKAADDRRIAQAVTALEGRTTELDGLVDCIREWGTGFADASIRRTGGKAEAGTVDLEKARKRRDSALDQIILTVIAFREIPPTATSADFDRVLTEYAAAIRNLNDVSREVDQTRTDNPYPPLECDVEPSEGEQQEE